MTLKQYVSSASLRVLAVTLLRGGLCPIYLLMHIQAPDGRTRLTSAATKYTAIHHCNKAGGNYQGFQVPGTFGKLHGNKFFQSALFGVKEYAIDK